ncbi:MAG: transcriptional regulator [Phyllobacteriaceae bacterium]|nr:transcriptional regulator [Phyllobacteriaceae bacterium]
MEIDAHPIGKLAILLSLSSNEEEETIRKSLAKEGRVRTAVTWVSGRKTEINKTFPRSIINAAMKANVVRDAPSATHALIHAGLEALGGLIPPVPGDSSLKVKVAVVSDGSWVAVAAYGESAFLPETNHERMGLGVMHL